MKPTCAKLLQYFALPSALRRFLVAARLGTKTSQAIVQPERCCTLIAPPLVIAFLSAFLLQGCQNLATEEQAYEENLCEVGEYAVTKPGGLPDCVSPEYKSLFEQGEALLKSDQYDQAIAKYSEAIKLYPKVWLAHSGRGRSYLEKRNFIRAREDLTLAIYSNPYDAESYLARSFAFCGEGRFVLGLSDINNAKELDQNLDRDYPGDVPNAITFCTQKSDIRGEQQIQHDRQLATAGILALRGGHTATLLPSGKVLITGGELAFPLSTSKFGASAAKAVLYDPIAGTFSTTGSMSTVRTNATATLLPGGMVLVAGGDDIHVKALRSAELYNPATGQFTATGNMTMARSGATATLLRNGKVLIAGAGEEASASAELYDPATGQFTVTGTMTTARKEATATLLPSGKVLIVGGDSEGGASGELYDPATGRFTALGSFDKKVKNSFSWYTATVLPSGKVLLLGGAAINHEASVKLYDPGTGRFTALESCTREEAEGMALLLPGGKVVTIGEKIHIYDPATRRFTAHDMTAARWQVVWRATATLLPNGKVFIMGGAGAYAPDAPAGELYNPATGQSRAVSE